MEQENDIIKDLPELKKLAAEIVAKLDGLTFSYAFKVLQLAEMQLREAECKTIFKNNHVDQVE
ncbi:MAG: hypothetical protein ACYC56_04230 [Candidatus Aquicultor sp.]